MYIRNDSASDRKIDIIGIYFKRVTAKNIMKKKMKIWRIP